MMMADMEMAPMMAMESSVASADGGGAAAGRRRRRRRWRSAAHRRRRWRRWHCRAPTLSRARSSCRASTWGRRGQRRCRGRSPTTLAPSRSSGMPPPPTARASAAARRRSSSCAKMSHSSDRCLASRGSVTRSRAASSSPPRPRLAPPASASLSRSRCRLPPTARRRRSSSAARRPRRSSRSLRPRRWRWSSLWKRRRSVKREPIVVATDASTGAQLDALSFEIPVVGALPRLSVATSRAIEASADGEPWAEGVALPAAAPNSAHLNLTVGVAAFAAVLPIAAALAEAPGARPRRDAAARAERDRLARFPRARGDARAVRRRRVGRRRPAPRRRARAAGGGGGAPRGAHRYVGAPLLLLLDAIAVHAVRVALAQRRRPRHASPPPAGGRGGARRPRRFEPTWRGRLITELDNEQARLRGVGDTVAERRALGGDWREARLASAAKKMLRMKALAAAAAARGGGGVGGFYVTMKGAPPPLTTTAAADRLADGGDGRRRRAPAVETRDRRLDPGILAETLEVGELLAEEGAKRRHPLVARDSALRAGGAATR